MGSAAGLLATCLAFHVCYFFSIFDIYFRSPIDSGIASVPVWEGSEAPAKRLVLFMADGLRADTCFRFLGRDERFHDQSMAALGEMRERSYTADKATWHEPGQDHSFLREVVEQRGTWGLSHTRVPTESRPGHVAVLAGFYEDVSAVTRGWQDNPVEFDHVFNQSRRAWLWGSPDITRMFAKTHAHVTDWFYSPEVEDFAAEDLTMLDTWVFDRVKAMLKEAATNATLKAAMAEDKVIFFLHLLGLDSNGHAHRPHSAEYQHNMAFVDRGVREISALFEEHFGNDGRTAFVFTADHGMGPQGAHGDGDPTNTRTPLVAWGAGVRGPIPTSSAKPNPPAATGGPEGGPKGGPEKASKEEEGFGKDTSQDTSQDTGTFEKRENMKSASQAQANTGFSAAEEAAMSRRWGLGHLERHDVAQADLAPLLASLIGVPVPVNSVGRLPLPLLEANEYGSRALLRNARQLLAQVLRKERARAERQLFVRPHAALGGVGAALAGAEAAADAGRFREAEEASRASMQVCLDALRYYQVYDRPFLMTVIVLGYCGWVLLLAGHLSVADDADPAEAWTAAAALAAAASAGVVVWLLLEESPPMYFAYVGFAAVFWVRVLRRGRVWAQWRSALAGDARRAAALAVYVAGTQVIVLGYSYRGVYAALFVAWGLWPLTVPCLRAPPSLTYASHTGAVKTVSGRAARLGWAASCSLLGGFSLLPLDVHDEPGLLLGGAALLVLLLGVLFRRDLVGLASAQRLAQLALVALAAALALATDASLKAKTGLPALNQALSWAVLLVAPALVVASRPTPYKRFLSVFAGLAAPYCLLSVNYEVLFFACLGATLLQWLVLERTIIYAHAHRGGGGGGGGKGEGTGVAQGGSPRAREGEGSLGKAGKGSAGGEGARSGGASGQAQRQGQGQGQGQGYAAEGDRASLEDVRSAFMFLSFVNIAFFGTGNIASMGSFQISSSFRFTTVFSPFVMGALLILKLLIPYTLVTALVAVVAGERRAAGASAVSPVRLFLLVLALNDLLAVHLFFWVRDSGSWKEIGNSISQFGFVNCQLFFIPLLFLLASAFMRDVSFALPKSSSKKQ